MSRQVGRPHGDKAKADKLFSLIIRSRGRCEGCGSAWNLQCAHVVSRRFANTRCDEDNAYCLCAKCHMFYTDHPVDFGLFVTERMGTEPYLRLQQRAHATTKVKWPEVVARLDARWKEIEAAA